MTLVLRCAPVVALLAMLGTPVNAQLQMGTIMGTATDPSGSPVDGTTVTLLDSLDRPLASAGTDAAGHFRLTNVAPGTYTLLAQAASLRARIESLRVAGAAPITVTIRLSAVAEEQVVVRPEEPAATRTEVTLGSESIARVPSRISTRGLQDAVATTPGWTAEDNGLLHVRGVDDGFLFVIDGVPVYERMDGLFGLSPHPSMVDSINVMTGYIPPEFGFKSGAVVDVRSAAGRGAGWTGTFDLSTGSDATRGISSLAGGPLSGTLRLTGGVTAQRSDRFLDPVHPDNLHNTGGTFSAFAQAGWTTATGSSLNFVSGGGVTQFDVPHGEEAEEAGQDQRQRTEQQWQTMSWQRPWSAWIISQIAGYHRWGSATLNGSPSDTPLFSDADRAMRRLGVLASVTRLAGAHTLKVGGEASRISLRERLLFFVTDEDEAEEAGLTDAVIDHDDDDPFEFSGDATPSLLSVYAQDSFRAGNRLTVDMGLRADWSRMLAFAWQVSPRLGVSFQWPSTRTTVRASAGRFFQPPQPENLLLASSEGARELSPFVDQTGGGGADLEPERQTAVEAGFEQFVGGVRIDASLWRRRVRNAADPNVFFGTTMIFPNTTDSGRATGLDVRLDVPRRRGVSGYVSYTNSHVVCGIL